VTRDQRGYETTLLLHSPHPGDRPRILYWYRTAPSLRVGRTALDEDTIRVIEDQHPGIEFDWPQLFEEMSMVVAEGERRPERRRRPRLREESVEPETPPATMAVAGNGGGAPAGIPAPTPPPAPEVESTVEDASEPAQANPLLEQLVGREIARKLRSRYRDLATRIAKARVDEQTRESWRVRSEALDPDRWVTPDGILNGIETADLLFDHLKREIG
jgi:hypothetical protein